MQNDSTQRACKPLKQKFMTKLSILTILTVLLLFSCQTRDNDKLVGIWTLTKKVKDGVEIKKEGNDTFQIKFLDNYEMLHLTNGNRSGIGFYSYKIIGDSIYRTCIQIDSLRKKDSISLGSNRFSIDLNTMSIETDKGTLYYKRETE
jgi:hypothetical protein